jgi:hypothetical protein
VQKCPAGFSHKKMIGNALRVALGIIQGNILLDFGGTERLRAFRSTIFTRKVAEMRCIFPSQLLSRKSVWSAPQSLSGQRPSICLRRPLCRLKAPLGLSLLRKCGRSKREIKNEFSAEDAQSASGGHFKSSMPRRAFCNFL